MAKRTVKDLDVKGKKVIVRVDFNVPITDGVITDDNRIQGALPTINYLVDNGAKVILMSHLGKVNHKDAEKLQADMASKSLLPVANALQKLVDAKVHFVASTRGKELEDSINELAEGEILIVENTRFEVGETKNDSKLSEYWASLGDLFVNDAFGTAHRAHASNVGIGSILPSALGFLVEKEVEMLSKAVYNAEKPVVAIIGGAKVSDKILVIENLLKTADKILIGGGMAYTFFKAQGLEIGNSLLEEDRLDVAKDILEKGKGKIVLPVDHVIANDFANPTDVKTVDVDQTPKGYMGLDIGPKTLELFRKELDGAKTVIWNGPMGVFEKEQFAKGTIGICEIIADLPGAMSVIGGGDSASAAINNGFADDFSHISTGGGASLEFMEGKELPGIAIVQDK
ncbi:MAG: phosphoglycerate kinase [Erysipelothrix sp.]|nr:phosphoglycerate kinase [Erysipelothrix sp.]